MKKKTYNHKPHVCLFCKVEVRRMHTHFTRKHANEERVKAIRALQDKKKRFWQWKKLTQEGDFRDNWKVTVTAGPLRLVKDPSKKHKIPNMKTYYNCLGCFGRIRTTSRRFHFKLCSERLKPELKSEDKEPKIKEESIKVQKSGLYRYFKRIKQEEVNSKTL